MLRISAAIVALAFLIPGVAQAHKLSLFATREGNQVTGTVYFPTGPAPAMQVKLLDASQKQLAKTQSDDQGAFTFTTDATPPLTLVSETDDGHRAEFVLEDSVQTPPEQASADSDPNIEAIVQRAVQGAVQPLRDQLAREADRAHVRDTIGGIGYILGIFGVWAMARGARKRG